VGAVVVLEEVLPELCPNNTGVAAMRPTARSEVNLGEYIFMF
jgi:hypothetical protein